MANKDTYILGGNFDVTIWSRERQPVSSGREVAWKQATHQWRRWEPSAFHGQTKWTTIAVKVNQQKMFLFFSISWNKTQEKLVPKRQHNLGQWVKSTETVYRKLCYPSRIEVFNTHREWGNGLQMPGLGAIVTHPLSTQSCSSEPLGQPDLLWAICRPSSKDNKKCLCSEDWEERIWL